MYSRIRKRECLSNEMLKESNIVQIFQDELFTEIVNFIVKSMKYSRYIQPVFKLSFLTNMYKNRLTQLMETYEQLRMPDVHSLLLRRRFLRISHT